MCSSDLFSLSFSLSPSPSLSLTRFISLLLPRPSNYPEITSDGQRHDYKREFDADLREYKQLCAEMDDINDQMNKLSRQLDSLDEGSSKYQVRFPTPRTAHTGLGFFYNPNPNNQNEGLG